MDFELAPESALEPSRTYGSFEEALASARKTAGRQGYSLVIHRRNTNKEGFETSVRVRCAKGRSYSPRETGTHPSKKRRTKTRKVSCPFRLLIARDGGSRWSIHHSPNEDAREHSHEPDSFGTFPADRGDIVRRHSAYIIAQWNARVKIYQILSGLRQSGDPDVWRLRRADISNFLAAHDRRVLGGRTSIQWVVDSLRDNPAFVSRYRTDEDGRIQCLFVAPRSGIELWKKNPDVLQSDCTYKTNRFRMPLLNFSGITNTKRSFSIAAVFLHNEVESTYTWALDQLRQLMEDEAIPAPRIICTDREKAMINALSKMAPWNESPLHICRWHVYANVLAKTKGYFPPAKKGEDGKILRDPLFVEFLQAFKQLTLAPTIPNYEERLSDFKAHGWPSAAVDYCLRSWIVPWREHFVNAFIDQHRHFGFTTTSSAESMHAAIKRHIPSSTGDIRSALRGLVSFWQAQAARLLAEDTFESGRSSTDTLNHTFSEIRGKVSEIALTLIGKELRALKKPKPGDVMPSLPCQCGTSIGLGLPCRHRLFQYQERGVAIPLEAVDRFWWLNRKLLVAGDNLPLGPYDPLVIKAKGRPKGSLGLGTRSHRRDPTLLDMALSAERREALQGTSSASSSLAPSASSSIAPSGRNRKQHIPPPVFVIPDEPETPSTTTNLTATRKALNWLEDHGDTYEAGTQMPRAYQQTACLLEELEAPDALKERELASSDSAVAPSEDEDEDGDVDGENGDSQEFWDDVAATASTPVNT